MKSNVVFVPCCMSTHIIFAPQVPHLSAVGEELVQLVRGGKHLRPGLHELQQVGPGLVHPVLPLCDGGGLRVAAAAAQLTAQN